MRFLVELLRTLPLQLVRLPGTERARQDGGLVGYVVRVVERLATGHFLERASLLNLPFATVISSGVFGVEKPQAVECARFLDFALRYASGYTRNDGVPSDSK